METSSLPLLERVVYKGIQLTILVVMLYKVFTESIYHVFNPNHPLGKPLAEGWIFKGVLRDMTDKKWSMWLALLWELSLCHLVFFTVSRLVQMLQPKALQPVQLFMSLVGCILLNSPVTFIMVAAIGGIFHFVSMSNHPLLVWSVCAFTFLFTTVDAFIRGPHDDDQMFVYITALAIARGTSFALEACSTFGVDRSDKAIGGLADEAGSFCEGSANHHDANGKFDGKYENMDFFIRNRQHNNEDPDTNLFSRMHYFFYLPLVFTGPVMTYNTFRKQLRQSPDPWTVRRVVTHLRAALGVLGWLFGCELMLQILHIHYLQISPDRLKVVTMPALLGIAVLLPQFKVMKYRVTFGLGRLAAALDDLHAPYGPESPVNVYYNTRMWKWFDNGMYQFLIRYIYLPLGGNRHSRSWHALATVLCVTSSALYLGRHSQSLLWMTFSVLSAVIHLGICVLTHSKSALKFKSQVPPAVVRHVKGLLYVPAVILTWLGFLALSNSHQTAAVFFDRLFLRAPWPYPLVVFAYLYTAVQLAMETEARLEACKNKLS